MDGNQSTPIPEQRPASPEVGAEQLLTDKLEAKSAPAAAESAANQPKRDDGVAAAQTQMASVATDDPTAAAGPGSTTPPTAAPAVAEDVDVIEPEWVKKAEEAVAAHRDDPREEEKAVEDLQREYLKTRYNLDVKSGDEKP